MRALTRSSSALVATSGTMTSGTTGLPVRFAGLDRRLEDGARLHLGDFRIGDGEPAAAEAEHRVEFGKLARAIRRACAGSAPIAAATSAISSSVMRQEFVQRRIEQADRHRQALP